MPTHYDLVINTDVLSVDQAAQTSLTRGLASGFAESVIAARSAFFRRTEQKLPAGGPHF